MTEQEKQQQMDADGIDLRILKKEIKLDDLDYLKKVARLVQEKSELIKSVLCIGFVDSNSTIDLNLAKATQPVKRFYLKPDREGECFAVLVYDNNDINAIPTAEIRLLNIVECSYLESVRCVIIAYKKKQTTT